jgi:hypothetical protein
MSGSRAHPPVRRAPVVAAALVVQAGLTASAQSPARTPEGRPDFQGTWLNDAATPLERPKELADRAYFTEAEARAYEQRSLLDRTVAISRGDPAYELEVAGDLDTYEPGHLLPGRRASLITDPPDGRMFEYACHEADHSMSNVLRGARFQERSSTRKP